MGRRAGHPATASVTLQQLHDAQLGTDKEPTRTSGHQEALENLVAKHIERTH